MLRGYGAVLPRDGRIPCPAVIDEGEALPLWILEVEARPSVTLAENGDFSASYPEELLSIEVYTKGKLKPGDVINADNVDLVQDLLDPVRYLQIKQQGRVLELVEATTDITKLSPMEYIEATLRHTRLPSAAGFAREGQ